MRKQIYTIIAGFLLTTMVAFWGCEPELVTTIKLPEEEPKLALSAYMITGEETNVVFLGRSIPNNKPVHGDAVVENGIIILSDGANQVLLQSVGMGYYQFPASAMAVLPGKTFTIRASAPGFEKEVTSQCKVPDDFTPVVETILVDSSLGTQVKSYMLNMRFRDIAGTQDFYRIAVEAICISDTDPDTAYFNMYTPQSQPELFKDEGKDGAWFPFRFSTEIYNWDGDTWYMVGYKITIFRTDEHYYKFHYPFVVLDYYEDNPFGEPTIIYTNVKGGYGIFAGVMKKTINVFL